MSLLSGGLTRRLALRMAFVAVGAVAITMSGLIGIYGLMQGHDVSFDGQDYAVILLFCVLGTLLGVIAAQSVARQISAPVRAVAAAARRIAANDLSARADQPDDTFGELRDLSRDFNLMASRLERLAGERKQLREGISHEMRTPLMILRGQLQGGLDGIYPVDDRLLAAALGQIETLNRIMDDLKAMENAEDYAFVQAEDSLALDEIVEELRRLMDAPFQQAGFDVEWRIEPVSAPADRTRIRQAVAALLQNLIIHADPGPARVTLRQDGANALISVEDSGPGLEPALRELIFEPFRRGPTKARGSGVGLTMARYTADAHQGSAHAEASSLGGSDFRILLPLRA